jgi:hypothetical protein
MTPREFENAMARAMGLSAFGTGARSTTDERAGEAEFVSVHYLWLTQLQFYHSPHMWTFALATAKSNRWRRAVLSISQVHADELDRKPSVSLEDIKPWVEVSAYPDQVMKALCNMDLITQRFGLWLDDNAYSHQLVFSTPDVHLSLLVSSPVHRDNESYMRLWQAIRQSYEEASKRYADAEIADYVRAFLARFI